MGGLVSVLVSILRVGLGWARRGKKLTHVHLCNNQKIVAFNEYDYGKMYVMYSEVIEQLLSAKLREQLHHIPHSQQEQRRRQQQQQHRQQ